MRTRANVAVVERIEKRYGGWTVYNLEVNEAHQYYITEKQVLVHNENGIIKEAIDGLQENLTGLQANMLRLQQAFEASTDPNTSQFFAQISRALIQRMAEIEADIELLKDSL